ncbi:MAG: hypothetical protein R3D90_09700 [Paracoccaceae bacterium]
MADEGKAPAVVTVRGPGLWARLFPPMTPEQAAIMAQVKLPCC